MRSRLPLPVLVVSCTVGDMQFLIELDGPILDVAPRYYRAHQHVQGNLGLPRRETREFWRLIRKGAEIPEIVRPTRPGQLDDYVRQFEQALVNREFLELDVPQPGVREHLARLADLGVCSLIAVRADRQAAQELLDRHELWRSFRSQHLLSQDRSVRLSQMAELIERENQTMAVVSCETMARAARSAGAMVAGISSGPCTPRRLRQAGVDLVVSDLGGLLDAVRSPTAELLRAGFRPPSGYA